MHYLGITFGRGQTTEMGLLVTCHYCALDHNLDHKHDDTEVDLSSDCCFFCGAKSANEPLAPDVPKVPRSTRPECGAIADCCILPSGHKEPHKNMHGWLWFEVGDNQQ